jgi:hypothetical protein
MVMGRRLALVMLLLLVVVHPAVGRAALEPNERRCFNVPGIAGDLALLNLTPVNATSAGYGYMTTGDAGGAITSNVNFAPGTIDPNLATADMTTFSGSTDGPSYTCFANSRHGRVDIVVDYMGTLDGSAVIHPESVNSRRVLDTREFHGGDRLGRRGRVCFSVPGAPDDVALVNLTPVMASGSGYGLLISSDIADAPVASNVNFALGTIDPNVAIAPIGADGKVCFVNSNHSAVDVVADHLGTIKSVSFVLPTPSGAPIRTLDTRIGLGGRRVGPRQRVCFAVAGSAGDAALVNLTPVRAAGAGYGLLVSSDRVQAPTASNVNFAPGTIDPNVAIAPIGTDGKVCFVNSDHADVDVVADHLGTVKSSAFRGNRVGTLERVLDTRGIGELTLTTTEASRLSTIDCYAGGGLCLSGGLSDDGRAIVFRSSDTGHAWSESVIVSQTGPVNRIDCPTATACFIAGGDVASGEPGFVVTTEDGGRTFERLSTLDASAAVTDITCPTFEVCTALIASVPPELLRTEDGGVSWHPVNHSFENVTQIDCPTVSVCYVNTGFKVARSDDAGASWTSTAQTNGQLLNLHCFDQARCVVVGVFVIGAGGINYFRQTHRTVDGGATWASSFGPVGGPSDCSEPDWCVQYATPSDIYLLRWVSDSLVSQQTAIDAPAHTGNDRPLRAIRCPIVSYCFVLGEAGSEEFITRVAHP